MPSRLPLPLKRRGWVSSASEASLGLAGIMAIEVFEGMQVGPPRS